MGITVHHQPVNNAASWNLHVWQSAWDGNIVQDTTGVPNGNLVEFQLPDSPDPRKLQFLFHSMGTWEDGSFTRRLFLTTPAEVWTFENSARVLYQDPFPVGVAFQTGDALTFQAITQSAFRGGRLYAWNPYDPTAPSAFFPQSARDDVNGVSTFRVVLLPWMTSGFHLKLMQPATGAWEPDASNRVWRPADGAQLWIKSGQCDVRSQPLALTPVALEVLYSAQLPAPPQLILADQVERSTFPVTVSALAPYAGSALFNVASCAASIFPGASYSVTSQQNVEQPAIPRPFPADPTALEAVSRFALGASAWLSDFPTVAPVPLAIQPLASSSFGSGLSVQISVGNGPPYLTVPATRQADGSWQATPTVALATTTAFDLLPAAGVEPKPYDWIDTSRYFTPPTPSVTLHTTEGVYGICTRAGTQFAEPPSRVALMQAAFGTAVAGAGIFASREMPAGTTIVGGDVYFVVHAPHAVCAALILVDATQARVLLPMTLTPDLIYWWCSIPAAQAPPGARYRFLLNDDVEVLDPGARAVTDQGGLKTAFGENPADPSTSWSVVLDVAAVSAVAHSQPWQTMGWQNFLIYEIHARRFTNLPAGTTVLPFDLLADELSAKSRLGQPGYLRQLPVTVLGLMPVNEFSNPLSWGYDPSYYFAIDGNYGGADGMARFLNAAHAAGRGVTMDVVYNHSLGSSLMSIAPDVYRNGDYDGDRMNCGHPMVLEYFRQASVYLFRTFGLDGYRFDDTQTIVAKCVGGWEFLGAIRTALRKAADAEGRAWPYLVAENSATNPWDISDPTFGVLDGQWDIDEVYRIRDVSYDTKNGSDNASPLKTEMDKPQYFGRPYYQATRFGESHDMVSGQDSLDIRIASRPPFEQGLRMAKALGTLTLLSNGVPMLFMGQEVAEAVAFSFDNNDQFINPQTTANTGVLHWFQQLMGLRNDPTKGLQGDANYQVVAIGNRTVAYQCGHGLFAVVTFGTANQQQNSSWLGLPAGAVYKEIFNSSWPDFRVESEAEQSNGAYDAQITSGQTLNLPSIGAVVLERR